MADEKPIKSVQDLPKWFKRDNYKSLYKRLSKEELTIEVRLRYRLIHNRFGALKNLEVDSIFKYFEEGDCSYKGYIFPLLAKQKKNATTAPLTDYMDKLINKFETVKNGGPVTAVDILDVSLIEEQVKLLKDHDEFKNSVDDKYTTWSSFAPVFDIESYLDHIPTYDGQLPIWVNLDLANYSDIDILQSFEKLLPKLRKCTGISETKKYKKRAGDIEKVEQYRLLELFDLNVWALANDFKIRNSVLAIALYPDGEKGETELVQTVHPHFKKIFSKEYWQEK
jgi:hypothetical protein